MIFSFDSDFIEDNLSNKNFYDDIGITLFNSPFIQNTPPVPPEPPEPPVPPIPISYICFIANTPIKTDHGIISISNINPMIHTIHKKKIVAITKTIIIDSYLICFEK
jgi:hypothetical protein